jgi:transposase
LYSGGESDAIVFAGFAGTCASGAESRGGSIGHCAALEVSRFYVYEVRDREQETGVRTSLPIGGHRKSRLAESEKALRSWIAAEPGLTLAQLQERLEAQSVSIKIGALWHQLNQWNLTFKKNAARQRTRARGRTEGAPLLE